MLFGSGKTGAKGAYKSTVWRMILAAVDSITADKHTLAEARRNPNSISNNELLSLIINEFSGCLGQGKEVRSQAVHLRACCCPEAMLYSLLKRRPYCGRIRQIPQKNTDKKDTSQKKEKERN